MFATTQDVEVKVEHGLARVLSVVDHHAVAGEPELPGDSGAGVEQSAEQRRSRGLGRGERRQVPARDDEDVRGRLGRDAGLFATAVALFGAVVFCSGMDHLFDLAKLGFVNFTIERAALQQLLMRAGDHPRAGRPAIRKLLDAAQGH